MPHNRLMQNIMIYYKKGFKMKKISLFVILGMTLAVAHSGGTDAYGCHHNHKTGGYHCHKSGVKVIKAKNISIDLDSKKDKDKLKKAPSQS
jgi:hypothetical protein